MISLNVLAYIYKLCIYYTYIFYYILGWIIWEPFSSRLKTIQSRIITSYWPQIRYVTYPIGSMGLAKLTYMKNHQNQSKSCSPMVNLHGICTHALSWSWTWRNLTTGDRKTHVSWSHGHTPHLIGNPDQSPWTISLAGSWRKKSTGFEKENDLNQTFMTLKDGGWPFSNSFET